MMNTNLSANFASSLQRQSCHHLVFIPDGNRRWAKNNNLEVSAGYDKWPENIPPFVTAAWSEGIYAVTVWLFSPENLQKRPPEQVDSFLAATGKLLDQLTPIAIAFQAKIMSRGDLNALKQRSSSLVSKLMYAKECTSQYQSKYILNFAVNYSGRKDFVQIARKIVELKLSPEEITEEAIEKITNPHDDFIPDPDLIIRTGNECRLSGFGSWHTQYSEFHFSKKLFPDFTLDDFRCVLKKYETVERRFSQ